MRRRPLRRIATILLAGGGLLVVSIPRVVIGAAPDVRIVTPAGITINGSSGDWDSPAADFLADMYEAGKPDKSVLAKLYGRYDCDARVFFVHVVTVSGWQVLPIDDSNYVKLGQTDKLVDGSDTANGNPPDFAYIGVTAWEASFKLAPGRYTGDGGLNVHAEVQPVSRASTAAVAGRRMDVSIVCPTPTPEPTAAPTAAPTQTPSAAPTEPASEEPSAPASGEPSEAPSAPASQEPSAPASEEPSAPGSEEPSTPGSLEPEVPSEEPSIPASEEPSTPASEVPSAPASEGPQPTPTPTGTSTPEQPEPPIVIPKVDDKGTPNRDDDRIVGGAQFEIRLDDGDKTYEPNADDGAALATVDATNGYAVYTPPGPGDYWIEEVVAPAGLTKAPAKLVPYEVPETPEICIIVGDQRHCRPDDQQSGGFTLAVVVDSPTGTYPTLPPTDVAPRQPEGGPGPDRDPLTILGALAAAAGAALLIVKPARRARAVPAAADDIEPEAPTQD